MKKRWLAVFCASLLAVFALGQAPEPSQSLRLDWDDNAEIDLSHYNIYRSTNVDGPFEMIGATTETLVTAWIEGHGAIESREIVFTSQGGEKVTASEFVDSDIEVGVVYYWHVTAVDTSGNESERSRLVGRAVVDIVAPSAPKRLR